MSDEKVINIVINKDSTFSNHFSRIAMDILREKKVTLTQLQRKLLDYYTEKHSEHPELVQWSTKNTYGRLLASTLELPQFTELLFSLGFSWGVNLLIKKEQAGVDYPSVWDQPVADLILKGYALGCLQNNEIHYIGQLAGMHPHELTKIVGVGSSTAKQIEVAMARLGVAFGTDIKGWKAPTK